MDKRNADAAVKRKVFTLRKRGWEYASIEKTLGIPYGTARRLGKEFDLKFGKPPARIRTPMKKGQAGMRDLRQNLTEYLSRVEGGESIEILQRGRVMARLVPPGGR